MNIREDYIYARQSVDRKDSISIESQIDFCKYELKGGSCKIFKDKGYSGKNTDRPEFQRLLDEIRKGKVRRVIVYKLDRISRSVPGVRRGVCFLHGKVRHLHPNGAGHAEYLHCVRPAGTGDHPEARHGRLLFPVPERLPHERPGPLRFPAGADHG